MEIQRRFHRTPLIFLFWAALWTAWGEPARLSFVPISVDASRVMRRGGSLAQMSVVMCALNWEAYRRAPHVTPMLSDLIALSRCADGNTTTMTFAELEREWTDRKCDRSVDSAAADDGCRPAGIIFHESRCGSTMATNMLAVCSQALVYSEPMFFEVPLLQLFEMKVITAEELRHSVRVLVAALGRPIWAAATATTAASGVSLEHAGMGWTPRYMFMKQRGRLSAHIGLFRAAFPATPWLFLYRNSLEVLVVLLARHSPSATLPDAADIGDRSRLALCIRDRGTRSVSPFVLTLLQAQTGYATRSTPVEDFCAVSLAEMLAVALLEATDARNRGVSVLPLALDDLRAPPVMNGAAALSSSMSSTAAHLRGAIDSAHRSYTDLRGVQNNHGQAVFVDFHVGREGSNSSSARGDGSGSPLMRTLLDLYRTHFAPEPGWLSLADEHAIVASSVRYSKAMGQVRDTVTGEVRYIMATGEKGLQPVLNNGSGNYFSPPSLDARGNFVDDSDEKQRKAWPALKLAAAKYLAPLEDAVRAFSTRTALNSGYKGDALLLQPNISNWDFSAAETVPALRSLAAARAVTYGTGSHLWKTAPRAVIAQSRSALSSSMSYSLKKDMAAIVSLTATMLFLLATCAICQWRTRRYGSCFTTYTGCWTRRSKHTLF